MSYTDEYYKALEEERKKKKKGVTSTNPSSNLLTTKQKTSNPLSAVRSLDPYRDIVGSAGLGFDDNDDIAPVKSDGKLDFFQKGSFSDGYQFGDVTKSVLGTVGDVGLDAFRGFASIPEGLADAVANYIIAPVADVAGADDFADRLRKATARDIYGELTQGADDYLEKYSLLGRTSDNIAKGVGQIGMILGTGGLGASAGLGSGGVTALTTGVMGVSGMGSGSSEAYSNGADTGEAELYGLISGGADALSELLFGGLGKSVNALGFNRGLLGADDLLAKKVSSLFSNQIAKNLAEYGIKASAEGVEEVVAGMAQALGKKLTYMSEEDLGKILEDENLLEQFIVGMGSSGFAQAPGLHNANKTQTDFITGYNQDEQTVLDKVVESKIAEREANGKKLTNKEKTEIEKSIREQIEKGYIKADTIESILGGESYGAFKSEIDTFFGSDTYKAYDSARKGEESLPELQKKYEELYKMPIGEKSDEQVDQQAELKRQIEAIQNSPKSADLRTQLDTEAVRIRELQSKLRNEVYGRVKNTRLAESYRELERSKQKFTADPSKYESEYARKTVQSIVDSGLGDNTNQFHDTVEFLARMSADKGVVFNLTDTEGVKKDGHYKEGYVTNGYVTGDGKITINKDSSNALHTIVGHEITHVLEKAIAKDGSEGSYSKLQQAIFEYAKTKEGLEKFNARLEAAREAYAGKDNTSAEAEVAADLVGEYLFTDYEFISNLSKTDRNVFQRIWDEVKYMAKVAVAGSKEARELEKAKKMFQKAYNENVKGKAEAEVETEAGAETNAEADVKLSIRKEAPPTNTQKAYKLMRLVDGKLYPLFIGNNEEVAVGTWYNADSPNLSQLKDLEPGTHLVNMETGEAISWDEYAEKYVPKKNGQPARNKPNKDDVHWANDNGYRFMHIEDKAGGKSESRMLKQYGDTRAYYNWGVNGSSKSKSGEGSASLYALRPGWHFGEVPSMHQIGYGGEDGDTVRLDNQVWVEVEMSADVDYNAEAEGNWGGDIPTHIPTDGYYKFATNPTQKKTKSGSTEADATKADWYVAGAFKVNRILSDAEADSIVENYNRKTGRNVPLDYRRNGGRVFNAETMSVEDATKYSLSKIVDKDGKSYGIGVHLDSTLLDNLTPEERVGMVKEYVKELGGELFTAYDGNGKPVDITIAKASARYRNRNGKRVPVNKDLTTKHIGNEVKQEAIALVDELIVAAEFYNSEAPRYAHGWLDNNGQNDWEYWTTYIQDKNNTIWEATLNIANSANGEKILYDISPIKKVGQSVKSDTIPTDDNVAQNEPNVNTWYSFTKDSDGKQLTKAQQEYFKDSKMRDAEGSLKPMYHGTSTGGFHTFDHGYSDDDTSFFFVDDNAVASSYSGTSEVYEAKTIRTAEDMNRFLAGIGRAGDFKAIEENGKFVLLEDGDEIATTDTAQDLYQEFCDYEGVGYGDVNYKVYLNLTNPLVIDAEGRDWNALPSVSGDNTGYEYIKVVEVGKGAAEVTVEYAMFGDPAPVRETVDLYERFDDGLADTLSNLAPGESVEGVYANPSTTRDYAKYAKENGYDGVIFNNIFDIGGWGSNGASEATVAIAFDSKQIKSTANENPTADPDIRYSLTKYTDDEKKAHNQAVLDYFGKTYRWAETGYVLLDGSRLDLSGKHEGAPGGYRTVDHRDIADALGSDYGGDSYSGSLVQFMSEGNIRIIPECDGINLSVKPNKAQEAALSSFVSNARGEVMLDIDDASGSTVVSVEYPRGTSAFKVLADIRGWFDNGIEPQVSSLSQFRDSLTKKGEEPNTYGDYHYYGRDIGYNDPLGEFIPTREDIAPAPAVAPETVSKTETVDNMFPDNTPTIDEELDNLLQQKEALENRMHEALNNEDYDAFAKVNDEYNSLMARLEELEQEATDMDADRLSSLDDADVPPVRENEWLDRADVVPLTKKAAQDIARDVRQRLALSNKQMYDVHMLIEEYSRSEFPDREQLFRDIKERFGTYTESEFDETVKEAKSYLRTYGLFVSDSIQKEIADYAHLMRKNRGRIRFSKEGTEVDVLYHELNSLFPHLFPESIIAPTDQFLQMVDVANMDAESKVEQDLPDDAIWDVADAIADSVTRYQQTQKEKDANKYGRESFNSLMRDADQYAPFVGDDIAPDVVAEPTEAEIAPAMENDIPAQNIAPSEATEPTTANERLAKKLENYEKELAKNQQLREQSAIDYDNEIARLQAEHDAKKNKRSLSAHDLLRRIERVKRMKNNVDADYAKRISDLGARIEKLSTKEAKTAAQRQTKMEQHTEKWKNMIGDTSTWKDMALGLSYKTKTLRRILRKVVRGADGKADIALADRIYDELETKYDHNEALLKRESQKVKAVFEKLNLNHHEDAYAHMLGELRHNPETTLTPDVVNDYYKKHKWSIDTKKVDTAITEARSTFDSLLVRVNNALREQGFKEIPYRKGYFPHFTNPKQGWLAKLLNWKTIDTEVPTSIAGLTETFTPQRSWQSFNKERKGDATDYSLYQGLDTYIHGALDWIYHIDDLQSRRALENHIRYVHSEEGVKARIDEIKANEEYDADEAQVLIDGVLKEAENPLSGLVRELMNRTNTLANKKSSMDRGMEDATNRKVYSVMTNLNNRINANMVVGSFSSALTNFIPMVQSWHQVSPYFTVRGLGDMIRSTVRDDGMIAKSDFLTNRLIEEEKLYQTGWDKVTDKAALMMNVIDNITSQTVWRSKYLQNIKEGMSESQAIKDADQFAKNLIAGRSRGNAPTIFDAKNPLVKIATAFQLEVANQYGYMFEDVPQDSKNKARLVKGYATAFIGSYLYNALYSSLVGRDAAFDPISIFEDLFNDLGFGDDDEEEPEDIVLNLVDNILDEVPYVGGLVGGGRIPISSALPYEGDYKSFIEDAFNGEVKAKEMLKPLYYLAMPVGGGQIKKTVEGLSMFDDDLPVAGSYTDSGALRFPVEDTLGNRIQAGMFGQYASQNAREYFDKGYAPMQEKQIQEYIDVDIPIRDYWEYREGLSGLTKAQEKVDYIYGLDLPIGKKNILVNNQLNRKEKVDLTEYGEYDNLEEFDFAKDNPEKYDFFTSIGVTYQDYKNADEKGKGVYNWAFENPEKYTVSKAVTGDLFKYKQYTSDLYEIRADKDSKGKTIVGSAKDKKIAYINGLDIDYGARLILFKDAYPADDTYNYQIIEYLNSRDDFTYEDRVTILKELGFTVTADGTAKWD